MFEKLEVVRMAQAMASYAGTRQEVIARNVANADTPGYKAMDLPDFAETYQSGGLPMRATRAGHFGAGHLGAGHMGSGTQAPDLIARAGHGAASPNGNTVSIETEMVKAVEVRQQHDMALSIYRSSSKILRAALGKGA